ncbi:MAG: immune inhibitor A, partial [Chloroflexota bacterium]
IYPTTRAFFGSEWSPGVDGDEHIYILLAKDIGANVAGYFSAGDEYPPESQKGSNGHEMFVLSGDNLKLWRTFTYSVLAHEFQHMIHWNLDRNETSFINEGLSEVSQLLNGYTEGFGHNVYLANPDYQLKDWPNGSSKTPNYGASFLFLLYFLERVGNIGISELVTEQANGLQGLDRVIEKLDIPPSPSQQLITADDLMIDWVLSNYVDDTSVEDGRYGYEKYSLDLQVSPTETVRDCASAPLYRVVHHYGVDYIRVICEGPQTMLFEGNVETKLLPEDAYSGEYAFWSNKGHQSDLTLTRTFDFSEYAGSLTFNYWTWFDIEKNWDYAYLLASTDGVKWEMLATPSGTDSDPSGNNYGWGLTGRSGNNGEWIQESVDISQFAGEVVQLRFEYITDSAVNGEGMLIDDISIPEIDYFSDFESGDDGWVADGFVQIVNALPQTFRIAMISIGDEISVNYISLDDFNRAIMALDFAEFDEYIFVVVGTTRFTRELADYSFSFTP